MSELQDVIGKYKVFLTRIPIIVADVIIDFVLDNFDTQSFDGEAWPDRKDGDRSRALLIGERGGAGRRSIRVTSRSQRHVEVGTDRKYMITHNEGGQVTMQVTPRMRRFFWAMHFKYETDGNGNLTIPEGEVRWKWMALKRGKTITFHMPKRQFLGPSKELEERIEKAIEQALQTIFT